MQKATWPGRGGPKVRPPPPSCCRAAVAAAAVPARCAPDKCCRSCCPPLVITAQGGDTITAHLDTTDVVDKLPIDQVAPPVPEVVR